MRNFIIFILFLSAFITAKCYGSESCSLEWLQEIHSKNAQRKDEVLANNLHYEAFSYYKNFIYCGDSFYSLPEVRKMSLNLVSFQDPNFGGWDKKNLHDGSQKKTLRDSYGNGTIDNGQSVGHVEFLSRVLVLTPLSEKRTISILRRSIMLALKKFFFSMQKPNGGFPMSYPLQPTYERFTKINQNSMVNVLRLLRSVKKEKRFNWVEESIRSEASRRYLLGTRFLIDSQVRSQGELTGWAQQYDEYTPARARTFEVPAVASSETLGVVRYLLELYPNGSAQELKDAVKSALKWLRSSVIYGVKFQKNSKGIVECSLDPESAYFSRYYDLNDGLPFFAFRTQHNEQGRVLKVSRWPSAKEFCELWSEYSKADSERANGYAWALSAGELSLLEEKLKALSKND